MADGGSVVVGVLQTTNIRGPVIPYARGYKSSKCVEPFTEEVSSAKSFNLDEVGVVHQVTLTLGAVQTDGDRKSVV